MKKNIYLLCGITILIYCLFFLSFEINANTPVLAGFKTNAYTYYYDIIPKGNLLNFTVLGNNVYYLEKENNNSHLNKIDIYTKETSKLTTIPSSECSLNKSLVICKNAEHTTIYDLNLKKNLVFPELVIVFPYKDTYLKLKKNIIYVVGKNTDYELIKLDSNYQEYQYIDFYYTTNNTYILFQNPEQSAYYLYDINNRTTKMFLKTNFATFNEGFIFYDFEDYTIINLENNTTNNYPNKLNELPSLITFENNFLYTYNNNVIASIDLTKDIIYEVTSKDIINLKVINNYLYILESENLKILKLNSITNLKTTTEEYNKKLKDEIYASIDTIATNYNINIYIKNGEIEFPDFSAEDIYNLNLVSEIIPRLTNILDKFTNEVYNNFYTKSYNGLHLYLTGKLTPSDLETQASNPAAYSLVYNNKYMIVIDITNKNIEELLCHEFMHNIEFSLKNNHYEPFINWNALNPENFSYLNSYTKPVIYNYTLTEENPDSIYFIDSYSHTFAEEDRARIFESICACNSKIDLQDYNHLNAKKNYLQEELISFFPSLKNTNLFPNINIEKLQN